MKLGIDNLRVILQEFRSHLKKEELEAFVGTTSKDVRTTIVSIQSRQETERTMVGMARLRGFLDRMKDLAITLYKLDGDTDYMSLVWGSLETILTTTSQDPKALDILLNAYDRLGCTIPVLCDLEPMFAAYPHLRQIAVLIYQNVLQFQECALRIVSHPNMRTLFRYMWYDYEPLFNATIQNLEGVQRLTKRIPRLNDTSASAASEGPSAFGFFAGNDGEAVEHNGDSNAHFRGIVSDSDVSEVLLQIENIEKSSEETNLILKTQKEQSHHERCVKVQEWIAGCFPYETHDRVYMKHCSYPKTGLWILKNPLIAAWLWDDLPRKPFLWIHGMPGAGKTVLASVLIEACKEIEKSHTAYFYCNYDDPETNTAMAILKGLLMQVITWRPELISYFDEQRKQSGEPTVGKEQTVKRLANLGFRDGDQTYVVVDGVDECSPEDRKFILRFLSDLVQDIDESDPGKLRITVISRHEPDIRKALLNAGELDIDLKSNGDDTKIYVQDYSQRIGLKFGLGDHEVRALCHKTCHFAAGQFLYATLVMNHLFTLDNLSRLRKEMRESQFPPGLSEVYERTMKRIKDKGSDSEWNTTQTLLGWMTCAARPMKLHEMQAALSINFDEGTADFEENTSRIHIHDLCGALVSVRDDRISFVHMTAREFIVKSGYIDFPLVHCQLANQCIRYLTLPFFDATLTKEELRMFLHNGYLAFADYAAAKWIYHVQRVAEQAQALADPKKWKDREVDVDELLEAMQAFHEKFEQDFQLDQDQAELRNVQTSLSPAILALLERCSIEDAESAFQTLWTHAQLSSAGDGYPRQITLQQLRKAVEQTREVLEEEFSGKGLTESDRGKLERYYGKKIYRCSKPSCFFFHQGFEDRAIRNEHVARHDRLFECLEPDCPAADFGFGDKKALQAHMHEAHPDSELTARIFGTAVVKRSTTVFQCEPCNMTFTRNAALQAHQRAHIGQKPFECSKCGKTFVRKWDCNRHEKTHSSM